MSKKYIPIFIILSILIATSLKISILTYNLPNSANVDEVQSIKVLNELNNVSLNPHFFNYPTFFYYCIHFIQKIFSSLNLILLGRIVNLCFSIFLAIITYLLGKQIFRSEIAGLTGFILTLFSQIISFTASYVITDILLSVFILISIYFYYDFLQTKRNLSRILSFIFAGLAFSTKYSALFLICTIIFLMLFEKDPPKIKPILINVVFLILGFCLIILPFMSFFRANSFLSGNHYAQNDLLFIERISRTLIISGIILIVLGVLLLSKKIILPGLYTSKILFGLIIICTVFVLGTPYSILDFKDFIYGFGQEMKNNIISGNTLSINQYVKYLLNYESILAILLSFIAIILMIRKKNVNVLIITYLIISIIGLGLSTRSYPRYLIPVLPIIYILSGYGLNEIAQLIKKKKESYSNIFLITASLFIIVELIMKMISSLNYSDINVFSLQILWH